jgi:hypothetical protein
VPLRRAEQLQDRQREAGGLAGAGLRGAEQVAAGEDDRNGLRLDRGGNGVALLRDRAEQLGLEPERIERSNDFLLVPAREGEPFYRFRPTLLGLLFEVQDGLTNDWNANRKYALQKPWGALYTSGRCCRRADHAVRCRAGSA